jgi:hypothetical protein
MINLSHTFCHESHIQQDVQADMDDEHVIPLDQSNEVDSFLPTSVSAPELITTLYSVTFSGHISNLFNYLNDADVVL